MLRRARAAILFFVLSGLFGLMGMMSVDVLDQLHALRTAASDNLQWSLAQVDTEFLRFRLEISNTRLTAERTGPETADYAELRKRYDIFFSRIDTFRATTTYSWLQERTDFVTDFTIATKELQQIGVIMGQSDQALAGQLDGLQQQADALGPTVRRLSLTGLAEFARHSDESRHEITSTLARLAVTAAGMFVTVSLLAVTLLRLYRLSERRGQEQTRTAARMQTVIETSLDGIIVCDSDARVVDFSPAAEAIFGYSAEEARGQDMRGLILPPSDSARSGPGNAKLEDVLHGRAADTPGRIYLNGADRLGRVFPAEVSVRKIQGQQGQIFVLFIRDISQLKQAEERLKAAHDQAVAGEQARADFVAVMSHEMRTPLNGLLGTMSLLKDTRLDARQRRYVDTMEVSGGLLSGLVNDVLDLSKLEAGMMRLNLRPFDLCRVLQDVVESQTHLARANGNTLAWAWDGPALPGTIGDAAKIRQVLLNFVNNATKFTRNGEIRLEVEALGNPAPRREVEFRVIDSGTGIAAADLERIFDDFEMLDSSYGRQGGTGLGLAISRRLVTLMGGSIGVESEPGAGSLFWMRLPLEVAEATSAESGLTGLTAASPARMPAEQRLQVLIVEDNEINRTILREMVEAEGHDVTEAADGHEGVLLANGRAFDIILMDVSMPVMDGQAATRAIRAGDGPSRGTPIVGVTAHALPEELAAFRAAGMTEVLKKPIDRPQLIAMLGRTFNRDLHLRIGAATDRAAMAPVPVLDTARLADLVGGGVTAPLRDLLGRFLDQLQEVRQGLVANGNNMPQPDADRQQLQALHRCAGAAATFGAMALHARLEAIESAATRGDRSLLAAAPHDLPPLLDTTAAAVRTWLDHQRGDMR
ncbi:PAS domain-containing hybrid sensor histidine kinase/response regulator [Fuscibacter oryzae]|uniref:histidine kinase n=1 Tax=Fuscibacter oryzae TaxID=2803939 RepID=A0A8J7MWC9_9RHOB|nr:PAS domain-containing hybrid sensor histidine kinase/response regulator [Fuscibacter oryzae]MBL4930040.1 response regulator [Fuscibacter oryzae]